VTALLALLKSKTFWMVRGGRVLSRHHRVHCLPDHGIRMEERAKCRSNSPNVMRR